MRKKIMFRFFPKDFGIFLYFYGNKFIINIHSVYLIYSTFIIIKNYS